MHFHLLTLALAAVGIAPFVSAGSASVSPRQLQQSLSNALSKHADFSAFNQVLSSYPSIIDNVTAGAENKITLLVPTNVAFSNFLKQSNASNITQIPVDRVLTLFRYHTMDAPLTAMNFSTPRGITYGDEAQGQVLYVSRDTINPAKLRVRQGFSYDDKAANLRAGLGQTAELTTIDGEWDGGYFQSIDTTLDAKPNVTCLGPNADAFDQAGNPEKSLGEEELKGPLLFHTLPEVAYSNFLEDGQEFTSLANVTVRVTLRGDEIWFNDAKVVSPNVLAGNPVTGNIHAAAVVALAAGVLLV
ncbi:hypothetical protein LZ30DRAFT_751627 [Colletotrichum cereale]|nr:hypothetical protein LZ30DRAFT_751627 [Colletotrichum cereale]